MSQENWLRLALLGPIVALCVAPPASAGATTVTLGPTDQRKLDEYLSSVRDIERRIQITEGYNALPHISFACSHRVTSIPNGCMS